MVLELAQTVVDTGCHLEGGGGSVNGKDGAVWEEYILPIPTSGTLIVL